MRVIKIADIPAGRNTGMGRQMWESADATVRLGHSVDIFCGTEVMPDSQWKKPRHLHFGRALVEFVEEKRRQGVTYDVAEIHEACAWDYAKARRRDRSFPPLVIKSHGLEEVMWELHLETNRKEGRSVPLKNRIATPLMRLSPIRRALVHSDQIIASNSDDAVFLQERLKIGKERITLGANGVNPFFLRERAVATKEIVTLLFVGTWLERKGVFLIPTVFANLKSRHPHLKLRIIGTGTAPDTVMEAFPLHLRNDIVVKVRVNDAELLEEYTNADIFFFPAYMEPWGLVLAEAAATGLPILTTNAGGPKDFLIPNQSAIFVAPGDTDAMTEGLEQLISDPAHRNALGAGARRQIEKYTWEFAAKTHIAAYDKAIELAGRHE